MNAANDLGATPLWTASQNGSAAMVKRLLEAGANPNLALLAGETPLMVAARSADIPKSSKQLLAKGGNPNAHGTRGQTALMWAVSQQHPDVVKVLIAHGADLKARSDVWSEVMAVPPHGYLPYNMTIPHGGETALMFAARVGDLESAKLLVAAGANVNDADAWGVSATTLAAHSGFTRSGLVPARQGRRSELRLRTASPRCTKPSCAATRRWWPRCSTIMRDPNAPLKTWTPTRRSSDDFHFEPALVGATPYWLAARFTEPGIMRLLVKHGADPLFVHHAEWVAEQGFGGVPRKETVNALMAATGMLRATPWVELERADRERGDARNRQTRSRALGPTSISPIPMGAPPWTPPRPCATSRLSTFWSRRALRRAYLRRLAEGPRWPRRARAG